MRRRLSHELMDDPQADRAQLDRALGFIRRINRRLGGVRALVGWLEAWSGGWPGGRPVTLLDIATGSADLPIAAVRWARGRGIDLRITAIDLHETTLDLAREHVASYPELADAITIRRADALGLMDLYKPGSFDYVHAGMFLHHLRETQVMTVLRIMDRLARAGLIWNDLIRSRLAHGAIRVITLGQPEMVRHDARVSVEAGFTRAEVMDLAGRVGIEQPRYHASFLSQRFTLTAQRDVSWDDAVRGLADPVTVPGRVGDV